jgi:stearoyl-CoA desaturase (delta-9 desaturase)
VADTPRGLAGGGEHDDIVYPAAIPFILVHLGCIAAIWSGVTWQAVTIGVVLYWLRIFAIGAGYHRYFSHRAYSTSRAFQLVLAVLAQSSAQKSVRPHAGTGGGWGGGRANPPMGRRSVGPLGRT